MFKCADCGLIFDESEIAEWQEERGEFWGMPAYEKMCGCPQCHSGDIDEFEVQNDDG